ncbi:MAG: hypothetical protein M1819_006155 [Sarea resinae]|nr:MAG: hypothetical protein M1819_006155 [Sarea resinae]
MSTSKSKTKKSTEEEKPHGYEFGGPIGALGITIGLPFACYLATFLCNDVSGCPVPSVLHPSTLTLAKLKADAGWPVDGLRDLIGAKAFGIVICYYTLSLLLQVILPGQESEGVELSSGGKLKYKFNAFNSAVAILAVALAGTIAQGADFVLWTYIWNHYTELLTANICISFALATFVYVRSFSVKSGNKDHRELAAGGHSGNMIYDWFIGRELNPRIALPILGDIDIKSFCELRPGMLGWMILDFTFIAQQYKRYGFVSDSIVLITLFQSIYVLDALWMEPAILTTMDITTDGFGFMLAFGDLVWVPFIYSLQTRYLAVYPVQLGLWGTLGVLAVQATGYYIFRSTNNEKNRFRTDPKDPKVAHLKYMETKSGSKLLVSGWWGTARHINYLGDWIMSWAWCLPTGIAGYLIEHPSKAPPVMDGSSTPLGDPILGHSVLAGQPVGTKVVQGEAKGYAMLITYFYVIYFAILLVHRELRDEEKCERKYGNDWEEYKRRVPSRIIPGVY